MLSIIEDNPQLQWYVVLNTTSDTPVLQAFHEHGGHDVLGLWLGTPYEDWKAVMPRIAAVDAKHPFLAWMQSDEAPDDWGMLVGAAQPYALVREHLQGLTQVWMPNGDYVFFRFFDPRFGLKVAELCDDSERSQLMGPMAVWTNGHDAVHNTEVKETSKQEFPWWSVPESVVKALTEDDLSMLIMNSLQWLKEECADLYFAYPEPIVKAKTTHLVQRFKKTNPDISLNHYLYQAFHREVYR
ncbi:DUF4123 domain-containing protein [Vibrio zhugei]|uniref:DUF4123 domain-containing protein n=1 Tax=Vibrio zhugei TaxID=2479546 RepID=A0ABV7CD55_9VIBR|nr:DUF4123 domain-containing protein [Vibrio zhugei]